MKLKLIKESGGALAYTIMWISLGDQFSMRKHDTKKEVLEHYNHLKNLGRQAIAIYRSCEVIENELE